MSEGSVKMKIQYVHKRCRGTLYIFICKDLQTAVWIYTKKEINNTDDDEKLSAYTVE